MATGSSTVLTSMVMRQRWGNLCRSVSRRVCAREKICSSPQNCGMYLVHTIYRERFAVNINVDENLTGINVDEKFTYIAKSILIHQYIPQTIKID